VRRAPHLDDTRPEASDERGRAEHAEQDAETATEHDLSHRGVRRQEQNSSRRAG
jgi:hypothetical protein